MNLKEGLRISIWCKSVLFSNGTFKMYTFFYLLEPSDHSPISQIREKRGSHCKWPCVLSSKPSPTAGVTCSWEAGSELNLCAPDLLPALPRPPLLHMAPLSPMLGPPLKERLFPKVESLSWGCLLHHSSGWHGHSRCSIAEYCSRLHSPFSLHRGDFYPCLSSNSFCELPSLLKGLAPPPCSQYLVSLQYLLRLTLLGCPFFPQASRHPTFGSPLYQWSQSLCSAFVLLGTSLIRDSWDSLHHLCFFTWIWGMCPIPSLAYDSQSSISSHNDWCLSLQ